MASTEESEELGALRTEISRLRSLLAAAPPIGSDASAIVALMRSVLIPMVLSDPRLPDNPLVFVNAAFEELSGYSASELIGRNCRFLQGSDTDPAAVARVREAVATRTPVSVELVNHRRDGSRFVNELYVSPVFSPSGELVHFLGSQVDVTERRAAIEAMEAMNATLEERVDEASSALSLYRDIVTSTPHPILAFDRDLRVTAFNQAHADKFRETQGVESEIGQRFPDLFIPKERGKVEALMRRALAGEAFATRVELGDPAFARMHWDIHHSPLRDETGAIVGASHHAIEVTAQVEAERALAASQDALRQSQKMEAIGQLTGGVAHDFNNLLTVIRGSVDLLRRDNVPSDRKARYLDAIADTSERAAKLTGQLLAFARRQTLEPEVFDVGHRLDAVVDMLDSVTGPRVSIRLELPSGACRVRADVSQFETALVNLAVNARDAMSGEGEIVVSLRCGASMPAIRGHAEGAGEFAAVAVTDAGTGIEPADLERIFEPFFTTKSVGRGTGLGLSQVFGFAKQSGGDVDVESTPGKGSSFTLYLPHALAKDEPVRHSEKRLPAPDERDACVLVVEDNLEVGRFATQLLDDLGYRTRWVTSAEEALDALGPDGAGFDLVFSDVVMPGIGGIELARRLARDLPAIPIVLASGYSHMLAQDGAEGFDLIHKPYSADQLSEALRRRLVDAD